MDAQAAQLRQQIEQTRAAMAAKLDLLEQHVSQRVAATLEETVIAPVCSVQETISRGTTLLHQAPCLIIAVGGLLGYTSAHPPRPPPRPPARVAATPLFEPPLAARHAGGLRLPSAAARTRDGPADAGGAHEGGNT